MEGEKRQTLDKEKEEEEKEGSLNARWAPPALRRSLVFLSPLSLSFFLQTTGNGKGGNTIGTAEHLLSLSLSLSQGIDDDEWNTNEE